MSFLFSPHAIGQQTPRQQQQRQRRQQQQRQQRRTTDFMLSKSWEIHLIFSGIARLVISTVGISRTIKTVRKLCTVGIYWRDPIIPVQLPQSLEWFPPRHHDNKDNNKRSHLGEESWTKGRRGCPISRCRVWTVLFWIVDNPWRGKRHWQVGIES